MSSKEDMTLSTWTFRQRHNKDTNFINAGRYQNLNIDKLFLKRLCLLDVLNKHKNGNYYLLFFSIIIRYFLFLELIDILLPLSKINKKIRIYFSFFSRHSDSASFTDSFTEEGATFLSVNYQNSQPQKHNKS